MDWRTVLYFVHVRITVRAALALCSQLITPVWGLVTGHHQQALCCCQEPFTPSSSSPNGTSESIKTIITASPTESKEIILGGQGKHRWGVWIYLSREWHDVHLARQPITFSSFCYCLVWIRWWLQHSFFQQYKGNSSKACQSPPCLAGNRNLCLAVLDQVQTLSTIMFLLQLWLNEPPSASTQYLSSEDIHCAFQRSIVCLWEPFCLTPRFLMVFNGETHTAFPRDHSQISARDT